MREQMDPQVAQAWLDGGYADDTHDITMEDMAYFIAGMKAEYRVICHENDYYFVNRVFESYEDAEHERQWRSVPEDWHVERIYVTSPEVIDDDAPR